MVKRAETVREGLKEHGYSCSLVNARFAKPLDEERLLAATEQHKLVVTLEENVCNGGMGEHVNRFYSEVGSLVHVLNIAIPDAYVEHGNVDVLCREIGIDPETIISRIVEAYDGILRKESED
jgi:1-deoxy-D-xylulose-5-phosphate synthase